LKIKYRDLSAICADVLRAAYRNILTWIGKALYAFGGSSKRIKKAALGEAEKLLNVLIIKE